jgi:hypothetical protein
MLLKRKLFVTTKRRLVYDVVFHWWFYCLPLSSLVSHIINVVSWVLLQLLGWLYCKASFVRLYICHEKWIVDKRC